MLKELAFVIIFICVKEWFPTEAQLTTRDLTRQCSTIGCKDLQIAKLEKLDVLTGMYTFNFF